MHFHAKGIIPAVVTPFDKDQNLNLSTLRRFVTFLIDSGVHGLFVVGSQGEFYALQTNEKRRVIETVVEETNKKIPVYAGTGAPTTRVSVILTKMAEDIGADAVSVITPFFITPSQDELHEHYATIAKSTKLPLLLYNNPARTGVSLSAPLVTRLSKIDNIIGIKDSSGDLSLTSEFIRLTDDNFSVLSGRDSLILGTLIYGGKGSVAATANVIPKIAVDIYNAFINGNLKRANEAQNKIALLRSAFNLGTFPTVIKDALELIGVEVGPARSPVRSLCKDKKEKLKDILTKIGAI